MDVAETILFFILVVIPLYATLIWTYFYPEESMLWGKRWLYKEEPEISEDAIRYTKTASLVSLVVLTILLFFIVL
ncbi:hypothetical protein [Neobacillus notoginsengisoli]|uniref:hypothetical protein n=1 Tax=Neobacillus notoginsengisoli TaxID=1578198 RepID=UPI001F0159E9|nr:hypothetical protein [Neobacillus notoginsengisoli]